MIETFFTVLLGILLIGQIYLLISVYLSPLADKRMEYRFLSVTMPLTIFEIYLVSIR